MDKFNAKDYGEKVNATIVGDILYIDAPRKKFLPKYAYYLCLSRKCKGICFRNASKIYSLEDMKEMEENWTYAKKKSKETI